MYWVFIIVKSHLISSVIIQSKLNTEKNWKINSCQPVLAVKHSQLLPDHSIYLLYECMVFDFIFTFAFSHDTDGRNVWSVGKHVGMIRQSISDHFVTI